GTIFVTSDIGQPFINSISNFMFPEYTAGCDTNSVNSIKGLAYALDCMGMAHAGLDVSDACPSQKMFGNKVVACYGKGKDYQCEVQGFELTKDPEYSDPKSWIIGMGDPNCLVYYEAFPEDQAADWKVRMKDFSWAGVAVGGVINVALSPVGGQAGAKGLKWLGTKAVKHVPYYANAASIAKNIYKKMSIGISTGIDDVVGKLTFRAFRNEREGIKGLKAIWKGTDDFVSKELTYDDAVMKDLAEVATEVTFKTIQRDGRRATYERMKREIATRIEGRGYTIAKGGDIHPDDIAALTVHQINMLQYAVGGKRLKGITALKKLQRWNIYADVTANAGKELTDKEINGVLKKGSKIYKHIPKSQRETIMHQTNELVTFFLNSRSVKSPVFRLGTLDIAEDIAPPEIDDATEAIEGFGTCAIMLKKVSLGSVACAFFVSAGMSAIYIDNQNERMLPVGINALGYKKNYKATDTEELSDIVNYYYVALNRDLAQNPKRFFLASPCKTEKVTVKYEKIGCYFTECHNDKIVCCGKKVYNKTTELYEITHYEWAQDSDCVTYSDDIVKKSVHNVGETVKRGFLTVIPGGAIVVLYAEVTDADTSVTLPGTDMEVEILGDYEIVKPQKAYDIEESNETKCVYDVGNKPMVSRCTGAYYASRWMRSDPEFFYTNNPYITTVGEMIDGTYARYKPTGKDDWSNTVEIEAAETYYRQDLNRELNATEFNIQAQKALDYNMGLIPISDVPSLYMNSSGNGIKQCLQLTERFEIFYNPWSIKTKDNIDALTVSVDFDYAHDGPNYCYGGADVVGGAIKVGTMIGLMVIDGIVVGGSTILSGGTAAPVVVPFMLFASGAAYETVSHFVDKGSAWPNRHIGLE
ncbi:MAG: hypothetical protein U9O53_03405, partial [archaeon]|nr:hypothetical protein [archaeon]